MNSFFIKNAAVVTPQDILRNSSVFVHEGLIEEISGGDHLAENDFPVIEGHGAYVMPGIIDVHTDALDAEIIPRPGADIPIDIAFRELERKMSGCGFTTVYHSMHLGYKVAEYGSRSKYKRSEVFENVYKAITGKTLLNNKIHLRFELSGIEAYEECLSYLEKGYISMLSVMDHTPGQGQFTREHFIEMCLNSGKTMEQALEEFEERNSRPVIEGDKLAFLIQKAKQLNITVASHDDDTVEKVNHMHALGVDICEFPINMETAVHAARLGQFVVGGASNILRGGSLSGNLNMKDAVLAGAVNGLCSDYYPPSILHSVIKLNKEHGMRLPDAVNLATVNPAKAAGIEHHTGSIVKGKDADLIIVKLVDGLPMVTHTIVRGRIMAQVANTVTYNELLN
jgi:alpha-D-ribose 1-methylphosphonate 5-triphosphate diphosphatase